MHRLLTAVTSLVELGLGGAQASVAVAHGLSCFFTCGIFPDQGSNLCLLHWQADSIFFFLIFMYLAASGLICYTWDLLGPGIEPVSPALAGGFFSVYVLTRVRAC